jgi:hypothetical protein
MKKNTTKSRGNVFIDLGFDQDEAAVLQMRANLMSDLFSASMSCCRTLLGPKNL